MLNSKSSDLCGSRESHEWHFESNPTFLVAEGGSTRPRILGHHARTQHRQAISGGKQWRDT